MQPLKRVNSIKPYRYLKVTYQFSFTNHINFSFGGLQLFRKKKIGDLKIGFNRLPKNGTANLRSYPLIIII